jgi:hypothetical protein
MTQNTVHSSHFYVLFACLSSEPLLRAYGACHCRLCSWHDVHDWANSGCSIAIASHESRGYWEPYTLLHVSRSISQARILNCSAPLDDMLSVASALPWRQHLLQHYGKGHG